MVDRTGGYIYQERIGQTLLHEIVAKYNDRPVMSPTRILRFTIIAIRIVQSRTLLSRHRLFEIKTFSVSTA